MRVCVSGAVSRLDEYQRLCFASFGVHAWLQLRLHLIGALLTTLVVAAALLPTIILSDRLIDNTSLLGIESVESTDGLVPPSTGSTIPSPLLWLSRIVISLSGVDKLATTGRGVVAATVGLGLTSTLPLKQLFSSLLTTLIRAEVLMVSGERLRDYCMVTHAHTHTYTHAHTHSYTHQDTTCVHTHSRCGRCSQHPLKSTSPALCA